MTFIPSDEAKDFMEFQETYDPGANNIIDKDDNWYYSDNKFITNSHLKYIIDGGPQHLKAYYEGKLGQDSQHYIFGKAQHCLILEPEAFNSRFYSIDDTEICIEASGVDWEKNNKNPRATKIYKEWLSKIMEENKHRQLISMNDFQILNDMYDKLMSYKQVREMLESAYKKETIYSNKIQGIDCKCKVDAINPGNFILDYKSSKDPATIHKFKYNLKKYNYDRQGAFYCDVTKTKSFWFIVQEKTYPYTVCIVEMSPDTYEEGRIKYQYGLDLYKNHFLSKSSKDIDSFLEIGSV